MFIKKSITFVNIIDKIMNLNFNNMAPMIMCIFYAEVGIV